jgi:hypothetical protein
LEPQVKRPNKALHLTGATILVFPEITHLQAASAGERCRSALRCEEVARLWKQRLFARVMDLLVIATFANVWLAAGHGVAPVGLLLFLGEEDWHRPMAVGWSGIVALAVLPLVLNRWWYNTLVVTAGLSLRTVSLVLFIHKSDVPVFSIPLAAGFAFTVVARAVYLCFQIRRRDVA